jgi:hypothetical protein
MYQYYGGCCVQLMLQLPFQQFAEVLLHTVSDIWSSLFPEKGPTVLTPPVASVHCLNSDFMAYK